MRIHAPKSCITDLKSVLVLRMVQITVQRLDLKYIFNGSLFEQSECPKLTQDLNLPFM